MLDRLFLDLDRFPEGPHRGAIAGLGLAKHVGMAAHQLGADAAGYGGQVEAAGFAGDAGVQHHLQQQVAQFLLQVVVVAVADRIGQLVGLLQHVGDQGGMGLLEVPGAAAFGIAEASHHRHQLGQGRFHRPRACCRVLGVNRHGAWGLEREGPAIGPHPAIFSCAACAAAASVGPDRRRCWSGQAGAVSAASGEAAWLCPTAAAA